MDRKIITVIGATGAQGGGLARAILLDPHREFSVRAVARDVNSEKAKELSRMGAEVVAGDVDDAASIERAFAGAHGAFCVTFFWAHFSPEKELTQARAMATAAEKAGVSHVIWSTLEDTRLRVPLDDDRMPTLMGKYKVPHLDAKGEANKFFLDARFGATCLNTSFYWDNFIHFGLGPKKGEDGRYAITLPMGDRKLPGIAAEDIGKCAFGIFRKGAEMYGRTVGIAGEHLTGAEMASAMSKALGVEVVYNAVPPEVYRGFGFPGADDLGNMFQYKHDFNEEFRKARSVEFSRSLNPELKNFAQWLAVSGANIPLS